MGTKYEVDNAGNISGETVVLASQATDPVSPVEGQLWYNSTDEVLKVRNSTTSEPIGASGWVKISDTDLSGGAATSLSSATLTEAYENYRIQIYGEFDATTAGVGLEINGDSGSNYQQNYIKWSNTTATANDATGSDYRIHTEGNGSDYFTAMIEIFKIASDRALISHLGGSGDQNGGGYTSTGMWTGTGDITIFKIQKSAGNFTTKTRMVVWGWKD